MQIRSDTPSAGDFRPFGRDVTEARWVIRRTGTRHLFFIFHLLHPLQPECMGFEAVYRQFGGKIALCAALSSQKLLPFGTPEDVRREVRRLAAVAADRRCLLMPSNVIQPETPWENVLAFVEEARAARHGR